MNVESLVDMCSDEVVKTTSDARNKAGRGQSWALLDTKNSINVAALLRVTQCTPEECQRLEGSAALHVTYHSLRTTMFSAVHVPLLFASAAFAAVFAVLNSASNCD